MTKKNETNTEVKKSAERGAASEAESGANRESLEKNAKAVKFQEFLADSDINVFSTESLDDEYQTVIFRSRIETKGQILPMAVLIDTSVFTIIRTQLVMGLSEEKQRALEPYLNQLNADYKIFKYYLRPDGIIYLDVCLPFVEETFDSKMIQLMLNVLLQHLEATFTKLMAKVWSENDTEEKKG